MTERLAPVLRTTDANTAVAWYARLGFVKQWEHRFAPGLPLYVSIARGSAEIHLSEHTGDARPGTLLYLYVDDIDAAAATCGRAVDQKDWGREFEVSDPDGNRLRVGALHR
ncbi:glyoxalase superfamily protein [Micromonospora lupini]|uniref:glyoxalase superfamily protein n=1 Tax=Micromonospora lupini TaxID=285679 RepID=UPI00224F020F|nr:glyoxalase superfamily protein [Micromonospora lupini]MCX5066541.1 glyoxalase superfamily protein [Micromonospora lupini]